MRSKRKHGRVVKLGLVAIERTW